MVVRRAKRHLGEQFRMQCLRQPCPASAAEDVILGSAGGALIVRHILNNPKHLMVRLQGHRARSGGYKGRCSMRGGYNNLLALRQHLVNVQRHIAGTRRQVK
ncbi:hypothetical protein D3C73_1157820 [compost metagenome]